MFKWAVSYATPTGLTSFHDAAQRLTTLYKKEIQSVKWGGKKLIQNAGTCEYIHAMLPTFLSLILRLFNDAVTKSGLIKDGKCT